MADVTLPQLGETVTEGTITQWFKQVGDTVAADEPLFEVSTDKVDTEVPSPIAGVLVEIRVAEGATIEVGSVVAVVGDAGAPAVAEPEPVVSAPAVAAPVVAAPAVAEPEPVVAEPVVATPVVAEPVVELSAPVASADQRLLSPVVRRLVNEHGIDPATIDGTGPGGRITREDVLDHLDARPAPSAPVVASPTAPAPAAPAPAPAVAAPAAPASAAPASAAPAPPVPTPAARPVVATGERATRVPLSKIRRLTGDHMIASKATSPHAFSVVEVDFANVDNARSAARAEFQASEGFGLTYLPFVVRAIVDGLAEFPHLNASLDGDDLVVHGFVDLGIAVDLDHEGLLAPVVRSAETKRLRAIAREIRDLADRARARRLSPDEISGGTFTISNNGSAGSVLTMPIINQPQVAIVSTDAIVRRPVVARTTDGSEAIVVHPVGNLAMSWDHRAFDGAYAAGFLSRVKEILETRNWNGEL